MKLYNIMALVSLLSPLCHSAIVNHHMVDVAIIGGGSSGIHAAVNLKDAGARVAVIEKKNQIGGHAETYINPKTRIPANIGVVLFENTEPGTDSTKMYDFTLGIHVPSQNREEVAAAKEVMAEAMETYSQNVLSKYSWIDRGYLVPDPVPEELLLPFGQFAQQNNFSAILHLISQLNWYPGNISAIPTLYGIKKFGPGLLQSVASEFLVAAPGDTGSIYRAASEVLGQNIYLDSELIKVRRKKHGAVVTFRHKGKIRIIKSRKLVVAVPQTIENMKYLDLTETERELFSRFSSFGYLAGDANTPDFDVSSQNVGIKSPAKTPTVPESNGFLSSGSPDQFVLGVGFDKSDYNVAGGKDIVRKELNTLARVGAVPANAAKGVTFPYVSNHAPYDLHVTGEQIEKGFYAKLIGLEGYLNTYWTGAAFAGHNSGLIWKWNDDAVLPTLKKDLGF
ncbi:hypothetical protein FLAG1_07857 [Fusarium langsethiae]|uniref:Amine oxidase domain-containing protein n=1 Tax=Fusarium langsethiae TaxID=179993 RepID=A0A0N0DD78_FUSLA|nr:hypothetical protein FLAG1_07857 [Fusarium langsethiae]